MAQALTVAQTLAITKTYFVDEGRLFESDTYDNNLLKLMPKLADAQGDSMKQPLLDGQIAGNSGDYDASIQGITAGSQVAFVLPWVKRYQMGLVADDLARLTSTNRGGFIQAKELVIKSAGSHFNDCTNYQFFRADDGAIGQVASGTLGPVMTAGVLTVNCTSDTATNVLQRIKTNGTAPVGGVGGGGTILNFSVGGPAGVTAGPGGALQTGDWVVTAIGDTSFQCMPLTGATMVTGSAYMYVKGDAKNAGSGVSQKSFSGLAAWVPPVIGSSNATFGTVDRSINWQGRAGQRVGPIGASVHEAYITAGNKAMLKGAKSSHVFCHPDRFNDLVNELQAAKRYNAEPKSLKGSAAMPKGLKLSADDAARFGFNGIALSQYAGREITIVPDWACQTNISWMLDLSKFTFRHTKEGFPYNRGIGMDGGDWFRQASVNWLMELFGIGQVACADPSKQVAIVHTATATS